MKYLFVRLFKKLHYLKPGTYEARIINSRVNKAGNLIVTLGDIKENKDGK